MFPLRTAALVAVLVLAAPAATAQVIPSLDLGVAGGVNFANLSDAGSVDLDNSTGYHVGVYADFGFLFVSTRTGLYYYRVGDIPGAGEGGDDGTVSFVTVPLDFHLQTPTPVLKAYALVGPEFRFPLGGIENLNVDDFDTEDVNTVLNVGLGVKGGVPLVGPSGFLELRYAYDPTGIRDTDSDEDYKVSLFLIRAGIGI